MNVAEQYLKIAPEIVLFIAAWLVLLLTVIKPKGNQRVSAYAVLIALGLALTGAVWSLANLGSASSSQIVGVLAVDKFAVILKPFVIFIAILVVFLSIRSAESESYGGEFNFLLLCSVLGVLLMIGATNLLMIFLAIELTSLPIYIMSGLRKTDPGSGEASFKYYLLGVLATAFLIYGISLIYGLTGTLDLRGISAFFSGNLVKLPSFWISVIFIVAGLGFKVAAVPFHAWAPDVYEGAPTQVVAYLSSAPKIAGFAVFLRIFLSGFGPQFADWTVTILVVSIVSMTVGNLIAIPQENIKRLLAYSSIAHAGYILIGVAAGTQLGVWAVVVYTLIYATMNLGALSIIYGFEKAGVGVNLFEYAGLGRRAPYPTFLLAILLISLAGLPPLAGFWAKLAIFYAAVNRGYYLVVVIAVLNSAVSLYYYANVLRVTYLKEPVRPTPVRVPGEAITIASIAVLAIAIIGVFPQPLFYLSQLGKLL